MIGHMRPRAFNRQAFLEIMTCAAFAGLVVYLAASGEYLRYLTPRMKPYLWFAAAVMLIWSAAGVGRLFRARHRARCAHCFVLVIPLLLAVVPHRAMGAGDVAPGYVTGSGGLISAGEAQDQPPARETDAAASDYTTSRSEAGDAEAGAAEASAAETGADAKEPASAPVSLSSGLMGLDAENRRISVGTEDYYLWICEIYDNLDYYEGFTLTVTGYVLKEPGVTGENEFVPARLLMSCCAADLVACGLLSSYEGAAELANDEWVTVEGVIEKGEYMGYAEARLAVVSVTPAEPIEGYVYG